MTRLNSRTDLVRLIAEQPIETRFYLDNYEEIVADALLEILRSKGFKWGDDHESYDITDREFWACFKAAEIVYCIYHVCNGDVSKVEENDIAAVSAECDYVNSVLCYAHSPEQARFLACTYDGYEIDLSELKIGTWEDPNYTVMVVDGRRYNKDNKLDY